MIRHFI